MEVFGNTLFEEGAVVDFNTISKIIKRPYIKPRYKISVLNPDETVNYIIPEEDIPIGGISYTEEYQNGQRRNISLELINKDGKYTPSINGIWLSTKFRFDVGIEYGEEIVWFPKGIFVMGDVSLTHNDSNKTVNIQLKDKFAIFEDKMGTLEDAYEIEIGSDISEAVSGILNFSIGNGTIFDYKPIVIDPVFVGFKTQATIRVDEGGNLGQVIAELATQLSAEYYYNNIGNLCFYPINETTDDSAKPIIWTFEHINRELHNMNLNYKNEEVVNVVKVVGDNIDKGIYSYVATNENPASPICIQQIGRRSAPRYSESNVWNNDVAEDLAKYYLRQNSFISVDFSCDVGFNPVLTVNNLVEVENEHIGLKRDKLLITSLSFSSESGLINLKLCNVTDLPFN